MPFKTALRTITAGGLLFSLIPELEYEGRVNTALQSKRDLWGEQLLSNLDGPTYENVLPLLRPLMLCGNELTSSGVYYLVFGRPESPEGGGDAALHVADGSQFIARHHKTGRRITLFVGPAGEERFGSALQRLKEPELYRGYQPVLLTEYADGSGNRYRQESFGDFLHDTQEIASFVRLQVHSPADRVGESVIRVHLPEPGLKIDRNRLVKDGKTHLYFSGKPEYDDTGLRYHFSPTPDHEERVYLIAPNRPQPAKAAYRCDESSHSAARQKVYDYWDSRLTEARLFEVPETPVMNAQRNILTQNLFLGWRYGYGNAYETFFQPEGNDAATLLGLFGYQKEQRACHQALLEKTKGREQYYNWENGEKLAHGAHYYLLTRDRSFIDQNKKRYDEYLEELSLQAQQDEHGLLRKEIYSGDIFTKDYYLHQQAVCWRGMRDMAMVYGLLGYKEDAEKYLAAAAHLKEALLKAVAQSEVTMEDGSLFIATQLLSGEQAYNPVTETRLGSYWNLVFPYALGSGILPEEKSERVLRYMINHGSFLLGLLRFNYYGLPIGSHQQDGLPGYFTTGADNVYLVNVIDALAAHDEADRIVLSLYGKMAHGMTRNTFVSGEGDSYGVFPGQYYRAMYLPPNGANNSLFLKILRTQMLFEKFGESGKPQELLLTHFTPRAWLEDGKEIRFTDAPSLFGPVSLRIRSRLSQNVVEARLTVPNRPVPAKVLLRLRTPGKAKIESVHVNGKLHKEVDRATETIDLSGQTGTLSVRVQYSKAQ